MSGFLQDHYKKHGHKGYVLKCDIRQYFSNIRHSGIEYLGFRFYLTETGKVIRRMKRASKQRFKKKLFKLQKEYVSGEIDLARVKQSLAGFKGHLKHGHTYHLRKKVFSKFVLQRNGGNL